MNELPDDTRLTSLAAEPQQELVPALGRGAALSPLVALCCVFGPLLAVMEGVPTDHMAAWGLLSLDAWPMTTHPRTELVPQPGSIGLWLQAMVATVVGPATLIGRWALPVIGGMLTVFIVYRLTRRLCGRRVAVLAALLLAVHPGLAVLVRTGGPEPLGLALALLSIWCFVRHLEEQTQRWSLGLVVGGLLWALSGLTWGLAAGWTGPILLAYLLVRLSVGRRQGPASPERSTDQRARLTTAAAIFCGTTLLCLGVAFWGMSYYGQTLVTQAEILPGVAQATSGLNPANQLALQSSLASQWIMQSQYLWGWVLIGMVTLGTDFLRATNPIVKARVAGLLVWLLLQSALGLCGMLWPSGTFTGPATNAWLLPPLVMLAACGVDAALRRLVSRQVLLIATGVTLGLTVGDATDSRFAGLATILAVVAVIPLGWLMWQQLRPGTLLREPSKRQWLQLMYVAVLICHVGQGGRELFAVDATVARLAQFERRLARVANVDRMLLLAPDRLAPVTLVYVLRSRWPGATLYQHQEAISDAALQSEFRRFVGGEMLVIEWVRRDARQPLSLMRRRNSTLVADPTRYRARRLSAWLVRINSTSVARSTTP